MATIPSTTGETRSLLVGAHLDTVASSPGANDNASGVAVVLAVGRILSATSPRNLAVTLVLFDEEEVGLVGARAYAQSTSPSETVAVHTVDQVAWDADGDRRFELELPDPSLVAGYTDAAAALGVSLVTTSTEGTDHQAFRDRGYVAAGLTEEYVGGDTSPYRHTAQDVVSTVDLDYLTLAARLVGRVIVSAVQ